MNLTKNHKPQNFVYLLYFQTTLRYMVMRIKHNETMGKIGEIVVVKIPINKLFILKKYYYRMEDTNSMM